MKYSSFLLIYFFHFIFTSTLNAQCPFNLGFENGSFDNWVCKQGTYATTGGAAIPVIRLFPVSPIAEQHTLTSGSAVDSNTNGAVTVVAPSGGNYSVKIGDNKGQLYTGAQYAMAEGISYSWEVTKANAMLSYMYAVVLEEPLNVLHSVVEAPKFEVLLTDNSTSPATQIACGYSTANSTEHTNLISGKSDGTNGNWWYSNWTQVDLNLSSYINKTITIEFRVNDCAPILQGKFASGTHAAYAYIDMKCGNSGLVRNPAICANISEASLCAGAGTNYKWQQLKKTTGVMDDSINQVCLKVKNPAAGEVYKVTYTSATGCDLEITDTLKSLQVGTIKNITLCAKQTPTYQLSAITNGTDNIAYSWASLPAGFISSLRKPIITTPTQNTAYVVTVRDTVNGCTASDTLHIVADCNLHVTAKDAVICSGNCVLLPAIVTGGTAPYTYLWQPGGLQSQTITVCPTSTTTYSISVTDALGATVSATATVLVNPLPDVKLAPFTVGVLTTSSPAFNLSGGTPIGGTYSGNGVMAGKFDPSLAGVGNHVITYSYSNDKGCRNSATQTIVVGNSSGITNISGTVGLSIYPNPHLQSFTIELTLTKAEQVSIKLVNMLGEVVNTIEHTTVTGIYKKQVNTTNLPAGIYFLSVQTQDRLLTKKLIKN